MLTPLALLALFAGLALVPLVGQDYPTGVGLGLLMWIALTQSWTILSGFAGYISLGHVVFFGLGGYFTVLTWGVLPIWLSLPLASLVTFVFAVAVSLPVLRVRGPYFCHSHLWARRVRQICRWRLKLISPVRPSRARRPELANAVLDHLVARRTRDRADVRHSPDAARPGPDRHSRG
jgi:hypothetical protein